MNRSGRSIKVLTAATVANITKLQKIRQQRSGMLYCGGMWGTSKILAMTKIQE